MIKVYAVIVLVGVAFATWAAIELQNKTDERFDITKQTSGRKPSKTDLPDDLDYDRKGAVAALRVFWKTPRNNMQPNPIFWAKGNLQVIQKDDWQSTELAYSKSTVPREKLHEMIRTMKALEADATGDLVVTIRETSGQDIVRQLSETKFRTLIDDWLGERKKRAYTLQAVNLTAEEHSAVKEASPWRIARVSLAKAMKNGPLKIRDRDVVKRIMTVLKKPAVFQSGETTALVTAVAVVDR